ncbi:DUF3168 domain-containing protein [Devosia sp. D6-9]|nr:DUF3168 domain-containing protein [Devosia sp. D6-9]
MSDPTIALQTAIMGRLRTGLAALEERVFDTVPAGAVRPYATVTSISSVPIDEVCWDRSDMRFQIDFWSDDTDSYQVKQIAGAGRDLLHEVELPIPGFGLDLMIVEGTFFSREEQTLLHRARMVVAAEAQPV